MEGKESETRERKKETENNVSNTQRDEEGKGYGQRSKIMNRKTHERSTGGPKE